MSRSGWQTFRKNLLIALLVPESKASRLQMNFNLPSLQWQVMHSPDVAAVVRNSAFQTGRTARQVLGVPERQCRPSFPPPLPRLIVPKMAAGLLTRS
jgi:hypothetical protein